MESYDGKVTHRLNCLMISIVNIHTVWNFWRVVKLYHGMVLKTLTPITPLRTIEQGGRSSVAEAAGLESFYLAA